MFTAVPAALSEWTDMFRSVLMMIICSQRKWPEEGWDDATIELLLADLAQMDSNNFPDNCGIGEREARFASGNIAAKGP